MILHSIRKQTETPFTADHRTLQPPSLADALIICATDQHIFTQHINRNPLPSGEDEHTAAVSQIIKPLPLQPNPTLQHSFAALLNQIEI